MAAEIGVAVIGYGLGGRVFHAPFISAVPGLRLRAIVQRRGDEAARAWPEVTVLRSVDDALRDPEIQLVVVSTPNETHDALATAALEAGKHVVIDKPFAPTTAEARALIELAARKGVLVCPFHNRRWDGDFQTLRQILTEGSLGRVVTIESHFDRFRPLQREGTWKEGSGPANGLLMDLAPHLLDQALALYGLPKSLQASVRRDRDSTEIEDAFDVTLEYDRLLFHARSSMLAAEPAPRFLVHGTRGSYRKEGVDPQEPALVAGNKVPPLGEGEWLVEDENAWGELVLAPDPAKPERLERTRVPTLPGDYRGFYANVRDAIRGEAPLAVGSEQGWEIAHLMELARESSRTGHRLAVDPYPGGQA